MLTQPAVRALLLSSAAGLSTLLGAAVICFTNGRNERMLSVALGFAAGIMLSVSFTDLYPNAELLFRAIHSDKMAVSFSVLLILFPV